MVLADLDGDGLPNDMCVSDPRVARLIVMPAPGSGDRYSPFSPDPAPLVADSVMALPTGALVGDFNEGNVLFRGATPFLIDADSMQFDGLPCCVGHEKFLDPRLYGVDLTRAPRFDPGTDWYAWSVLLFSSLLYVHPFGGIHKKFATPLRRAEARYSVLRPDVTYPLHPPPRRR